MVGEAGGAADTLATWQSYARHAWSEHNALQRKCAELRELLLLCTAPLHTSPL